MKIVLDKGDWCSRHGYDSDDCHLYDCLHKAPEHTTALVVSQEGMDRIRKALRVCLTVAGVVNLPPLHDGIEELLKEIEQ
jgi:hypothetical protein